MAHSLLLRRYSYSALSRISASIASPLARCSCNSGHRALNSAPSPWLMLPPAFNGGEMVYRFYNLADHRIETLPKRSIGKYEPELPDDECEFVGSSHGWLALFNPLTNDLFLSNPITRRHIKLPSIQTLLGPKTMSHGIVSKVILSCSPDQEDDECRALMIFGREDRLAFCQPRHSTKWTPIGNLQCDYGDIVYSTRQKLFFCLTEHYGLLECWDLRDPKMIPEICWSAQIPRLIDEVAILEESLINCSVYGQADVAIQVHLAFAEQSNQLFIVKRRVCSRMSPDGSYPVPIYFSKYRGWDNNKYPYQTYGFRVNKADWNMEDKGEQKVKLTDTGSSLDGAAMFLGMNHSFVITSVDEFPELKLNPDCIYFTDAKRHPVPAGSIYSGHDIGMFHYVTRTFAPCFYPLEVDKIRRIVPAPMWFTPSPTILHKYD